jgi:CBS domain-containing protein
MKNKTVKDLMIPLENYASVHQDATLLDVALEMQKSQDKLTPGMQPIRAVLVVDHNNSIIGKIGHLAFLKALEPKYNKIVDFEKLTRVGVSPALISSISDNLRLWEDDLSSINKRASSIRAVDAMNPVSESIDENASITEAIHQIIVLQLLSLLVKSGSKIVGIIRLSDLYDEVGRNILNDFNNVNK